MAIKQTRTSDMSGEPIPEGTGARVRVMFFTKGQVDLRADLTDEEVDALVTEYNLSPVETRASRAGEKRNRPLQASEE